MLNRKPVNPPLDIDYRLILLGSVQKVFEGKSGLKGIKSFIIAFTFCAVYAITDEIHQLFVPGRACELIDLIMDCTGALIGIGIYYLIVLAIRNIKRLIIWAKVV